MGGKECQLLRQVLPYRQLDELYTPANQHSVVEACEKDLLYLYQCIGLQFCSEYREGEGKGLILRFSTTYGGLNQLRDSRFGLCLSRTWPSVIDLLQGRSPKGFESCY
jgi:hypothetical protein